MWPAHWRLARRPPVPPPIICQTAARTPRRRPRSAVFLASFYRHQSSSGTTGQAINDAFPVAGPKTWKVLPEDVTSSQSEYTFRRRLKTWLFKKTFPDIIIWYWRHHEFSLGLSVPTLKQFFPLRSTIWYDMIWYGDLRKIITQVTKSLFVCFCHLPPTFYAFIFCPVNFIRHSHLRCQYQCKCLPGKTRLRNIIMSNCILTHSLTLIFNVISETSLSRQSLALFLENSWRNHVQCFTQNPT